ncbi:hypothetical protein VP01_357g3 [Puccinia sorghi]|uniref:Uncharacterized protein n=1 Tax=Puccinia sorghi TaxID=27349 RepID=A0A0L6UVB1_9BASI|nr:hypothetical protein VP01_357g3 [Puccinia sorghi]
MASASFIHLTQSCQSNIFQKDSPTTHQVSNSTSVEESGERRYLTRFYYVSPFIIFQSTLVSVWKRVTKFGSWILFMPRSSEAGLGWANSWEQVNSFDFFKSFPPSRKYFGEGEEILNNFPNINQKKKLITMGRLYPGVKISLLNLISLFFLFFFYFTPFLIFQILVLLYSIYHCLRRPKLLQPNLYFGISQLKKKKLFQLPAVNMQKVPGSLLCYSKISPRVIQPRFDAYELFFSVIPLLYLLNFQDSKNSTTGMILHSKKLATFLNFVLHLERLKTILVNKYLTIKELPTSSEIKEIIEFPSYIKILLHLLKPQVLEKNKDVEGGSSVPYSISLARKDDHFYSSRRMFFTDLIKEGNGKIRIRGQKLKFQHQEPKFFHTSELIRHCFFIEYMSSKETFTPIKKKCMHCCLPGFTMGSEGNSSPQIPKNPWLWGTNPQIICTEPSRYNLKPLEINLGHWKQLPASPSTSKFAEIISNIPPMAPDHSSSQGSSCGTNVGYGVIFLKCRLFFINFFGAIHLGHFDFFPTLSIVQIPMIKTLCFKLLKKKQYSESQNDYHQICSILHPKKLNEKNNPHFRNLTCGPHFCTANWFCNPPEPAPVAISSRRIAPEFKKKIHKPLMTNQKLPIINKIESFLTDYLKKMIDACAMIVDPTFKTNSCKNSDVFITFIEKYPLINQVACFMPFQSTIHQRYFEAKIMKTSSLMRIQYWGNGQKYFPTLSFSHYATNHINGQKIIR